MKYFSMFSGIGGFELGIDKAVQCQTGIQSKRQVDVLRPERDCSDSNISLRDGGRARPVCVGFSEIDKYAIKIYESHFGGHKNYGDATKIDPNTLPDFDLLVGGFPCQAFSIAGKRLGFDDTRGTLFFDIARILKVKRPRMFLLENVKGLLSHDSGRTFKTIVTTLAELGYAVEWQVLNSKNHGVPQNRERVFIVGHLGGFGGREVFPIGEGDEFNIQQKQKLQVSISNCLRTNYSTRFSNETYVHEQIKATQSLPDAQRVRETDGLATTLKGLGGGQGAKTGPYRTEGMRIRRLTPTECERLQGFPEIEKYSTIKICIDHQKNPASAEILNHKLPSSAESVGKKDYQGHVLSAELSTNTSNQPESRHAQPDVLINCVENGVEILSQGKCLLSAINANKKEWCHQLIKIDDFVQLLVGVNIMLERKTLHGKAASRQNEDCLIIQESGLKQERLSGSEITPLADDVEIGLTTLKELLKFTTLDHLSTGYSEQRLATLFWYVIHVINGFIPKEISEQNIFTIGIKTRVGYTYGVSDSQRYKTLGNSVTVNVIKDIMTKIIECLKP